MDCLVFLVMSAEVSLVNLDRRENLEISDRMEWMDSLVFLDCPERSATLELKENTENLDMLDNPVETDSPDSQVSRASMVHPVSLEPLDSPAQM